MKQLLSLLTDAAGFPSFAADGKKGNGVLVAYFTWSPAQNTKQMAEQIAAATGGDLFRIEPEEAYPADYRKTVQIVKDEMQGNIRPKLKSTMTQAELNRYDTVFVGFPVWCYDAPMVVYSFLEPLDLSGKTVVPFATSGGGEMNDRNLRAKIPATFKDSLCIAGYSPGESSSRKITEWLSALGFSL